MGFIGFPQDVHSFSAAEVGAALAALVVREPSGLPRTGMLGKGPTLTAVPASWKVEVSPFVYAHTANGGTQWSGEPEPVQVDVTPSTSIPAGQSRIDVVAWDPVAAVMSVVQGVAAASPVVPGLGELVNVGEVRVNAGDGMVVQSKIAPRYQFADRVTAKITTLAPGYTVSAASRLERDASGMVDAYVEILASGTLQSASWTVTVPVGFGPETVQEFVGAASQGSSNAGPAFGQLSTDRGIRIYNPPSGAKKFAFHHRYRARL